MEIWRDAKGFEGFYEVSSLGRVRAKARVVKIKDFNRHLAGKVRAAKDDTHGYLIVDLYKDGKRSKVKVHRLVLESFLPVDGCEHLDVNHKDGNKKNNALENLEWCTRRENLIHAVKSGLTSQNVPIVAQKGGKEYRAESIYGMYDILSHIERIACKRKTFGGNVLRAIQTGGLYYGYSFRREVIE